MPRLRPVTKLEEIDKIPADQDVTIDLSTLEEKVIVVNTETNEVKEEVQLSDNNASLLKKLSRLEEAEEDYNKKVEQANREAEQARRERDEAVVRERQQAQQVQRVSADKEQAQLDAILNAIGAANAEAESAQAEIAEAINAQDAIAQAQAYRKLSKIENRLATLEEGRDRFEAEKEQRKNQPQIQQPQRQPSTDEIINNMQGLMDSERSWLKQHPDALTDPKKYQRLQFAYEDAMSEGLERGSDEYFDFINSSLRYKKVEKVGQRPQEEKIEKPINTNKRNTTVSAPVSRQTVDVSTGHTQDSPGQMTLTPAEREIASQIKESHNRTVSNPSERWTDAQALVEYAKQKVKYQQMKRDGYYSQG